MSYRVNALSTLYSFDLFAYGRDTDIDDDNEPCEPEEESLALDGNGLPELAEAAYEEDCLSSRLEEIEFFYFPNGACDQMMDALPPRGMGKAKATRNKWDLGFEPLRSKPRSWKAYRHSQRRRYVTAHVLPYELEI